jgi:UDP-N-acetylglucosamine diphosphorylase/glucosamine-1-phosphate N-acetyltransferase
MNLILFDDHSIRENLLPFTFTRPVADIRIGILTIREKWEKRLRVSSSSCTEAYLQKKFPLTSEVLSDNVWINASICPNDALLAEILALMADCSLMKGDILIAWRAGNKVPVASAPGRADWPAPRIRTEVKSPFIQVKALWDIFRLNAEAIHEDFDFLTLGRVSQALSKTNTLIGSEIFLEEGAQVECAILNASTGPIYIGKHAEVMEGAVIRGPFALCEHAVVKMAAKIYGATTIGPFSKVGGEISNSVIFGFSNKAHDGFLGNSVLGEWCNLGADTNNSNLKNNYGEVKVYHYGEKKTKGTGLQFCGLMMGDHSKSGINTMFNTGTVVGVSANVFGGGFPDTFIPDFSWGGEGKREVFKLHKALEVAERVYDRRAIPFGERDAKIFSHIFELTKASRT